MRETDIPVLLRHFDRDFSPPPPPLPACPYCEEPRAVHEFTTGWRVQCKPGCYVGPSAPTEAAAIRLVTIREEIARAEGRVEAARAYGARPHIARETAMLDSLRAELTALKEQRHG